MRGKQRILLLTGHDDSSMVADYLCDWAIEKDVAVACFYFDFASREEQSPTNMLGSLLKQLLNALETIPAEIVQKFQQQKKMIGGRALQLPDVVKMFPTVLSLQRTFICVDALDECIPTYRLEVLDALGQILQMSPNIRMFMTGRSHIRGAVERELGGRVISLSIKPRDDDIVTYLRVRLRKDTTPEVMNNKLEDDIMKRIPQKVPETYVAVGARKLHRPYADRCKYRFLLVSLKVDSILGGTTIDQRRKRLHAMGDRLELGQAYEETLQRIRAQDGGKGGLAMTTLMWICHSERPLRTDELCHALAVEVGSTYLNSDNVPAIETLLACCQGLVTVDNQASTVRLIHHTLREYLCTHCNLFPRAHLEIAETCLTYLDSDQVKRQPDLSSIPFLKYCSRYWGTHAKREHSDRMTSLAMEILGQYENHVAANSLLEQVLHPNDCPDVNAPLLFGGLHCASFFGVVEFITALLGVDGCDANVGDSTGMTSLIWAAKGGQEEAVVLLLSQKAVDPNKPDNSGNTPLAWAAVSGHESVVKQLLERGDVDPNKPNCQGNPPLSQAVLRGHEAVVKLLLDQERVNPDKPGNYGWTPLSIAVVFGRGSVVKQLLNSKDVNPNKPDSEGRTPLSLAAASGHGLVIEQLLAREDVDPNQPDNDGWTPLLHAASGGRSTVVKQLLGRGDVNPDKPEKKGKTPLSWAALNGHSSVVEQLLDRGSVNPNNPDENGRTPLSWAAINGHEAVVRYLLGRGDVDPDRRDHEGTTPLSWAAIKGHESVAKQLLDHEDVKPDEPDNVGRTPLFWAAAKGHSSVVKQLLDREDVKPDKPDDEGRTPLSWAASRGQELVVKQLLDRGDVDPNGSDKEGKTPLLWAATKGHESVVKQLLDRKNIIPHKPDHEGTTPLAQAALSGHEAVVKQLSDRKHVNPDIPDDAGHRKRVRLEGEATSRPEDVNPDKPDNVGQTPLS